MPVFLFTLYLVALIYESFTKGWLTLLLLPLLIVLIPVAITMAVINRRQQIQRFDRRLQWMYRLTLASILLFYIAMPGVGDTEEVLLFGFLTAKVTDLITTVSGGIAVVLLYAAPTCFVLWLILSVQHRRHIQLVG